MRLNLWSSPRNISTAIMYSFAQRADTRVVDEPLYAHYLCNQPTTALHPGREAVLASQDQDGAAVIRHLLSHDYGRRLVVFKQMTHHLVGLDEGSVEAILGSAAMPKVGNVLLIRDPKAILRSFSKVVAEVTAADIGLPQQYQLWQKLRDSNRLTAIVDARRLLLNPEDQLQHLCHLIGVPFDPAMLQWSPGPRPEDGIWASHWYANVHQSTGFQPYRERPFDLSPSATEIADRCAPIYEELLAAAI